MARRTPTQHRSRFWRRLIIVCSVVILLLAALIADLHRLSPVRRDWLIKMLEERYHAKVELKSFRASLLPAIVVVGEGLVLKRDDDAGLPPIATIRSFSINASWLGVLRYPRRFRQVHLEGLVIDVARHAEVRPRKKKREVHPFIIDQVFADGTTLNIYPAKPDKPPTVFDIEKLRLQSAGVGQPMSFEAVLTNPKPVGRIQSSGRFGPWNADEPSRTPVSGRYSFEHADLSTIRGLAGTLKSEGSYHGVLNAIEVQGETDTPNFALGTSAHPVHLRTDFEAEVDGTRGDTSLRTVTAQIQRSTVVANGDIVKTARGRFIQLEVRARPARLQDLLELSVKSRPPPMIGEVAIATKFDLDPGAEDVIKRLKLNGTFQIASARFTDSETERKITELSLRGEGRHSKAAQSGQVPQDVALDMQGHFVFGKGMATFSNLSFLVPGAAVRLRGTFDLVTQALNFDGDLRLQAKASQMTTGIKSLLLKPIDPFFAGEGAGMILPIHIKGTKAQPSFGIEFGKLIRRER